ncbi:MAG TPA: UDP-N-acetylmuramate--L-alanine ligase [Thermoanaerobaculia bacterium]|nr:UDP-N-acetylmuramate--L-alanine ligase [Thermoanaerobaculia bacterium]
MNFDHIKTIHFAGIGGIGMSGLAEILADWGFAVSGCDLRPPSPELLAGRGIAVAAGHDPIHLDGVDLLVVTSAIRGANPEVEEALRRGIPVVKRAEVLGEIVNRRRGIGVSGTHGKTTTSAMIAMVLQEAGLDPTMVVGGVVRNFSTNAKTGKGEYIVAEADEYDRSFHHLHPEVAVVTNIEPDHLEYYGSFEAIVEAFGRFVGGIAPGGVVVGCADDESVASLLDAVPRRVVRYGLSRSAALRAEDLSFSTRGTSFEVISDGRRLGTFRLSVPGEHNVRNALAAIAVGLELGIRTQVIAAALAKFIGVGRRFQILGECAGAIVVDDYAHHPTEIRATLSAARGGYPGRRIVALFQPHLYTRTRDFAAEFARALSAADVALLVPIYAAREEAIEGISSRLISEAPGGERIEYLDGANDEIAGRVRGRLTANDLFITMGAGDVHTIAEALVAGEAR